MAVLEKRAEMPFDFPQFLDASPRKSAAQEQRKRKRGSLESWRKIGGGGGEKNTPDGFVGLLDTADGPVIVEEVCDFFGFGEDFPAGQLICASAGAAGNTSQVRYVSAAARQFMADSPQVRWVYM